MSFATQCGREDLIVAASHGDIDAVMDLVEAGANVDLQREVICRYKLIYK